MRPRKKKHKITPEHSIYPILHRKLETSNYPQVTFYENLIPVFSKLKFIGRKNKFLFACYVQLSLSIHRANGSMTPLMLPI